MSLKLTNRGFDNRLKKYRSDPYVIVIMDKLKQIAMYSATPLLKADEIPGFKELNEILEDFRITHYPELAPYDPSVNNLTALIEKTNLFHKTFRTNYKPSLDKIDQRLSLMPEWLGYEAESKILNYRTWDAYKSLGMWIHYRCADDEANSFDQWLWMNGYFELIF